MTQCEDELCSNQTSLRVFPCLYHCKKMLCIQHLSEHDKYIEKQIQFQKQLENLWKNYMELFNYEKIQKEFQLLKIKMDNYQQLNKNINELLLMKQFDESVENEQKFQIAIQTVQKAIEQENQAKFFPKIELQMDDDDEEGEEEPVIDYASLYSFNDDSLPSMENTNGNSPSNEQDNECFQDVNDSNLSPADEDEPSLKDETNVTPNRPITASSIRGYCPLTEDGVFGLNSSLHGVRLCPKKSPENQRTYCLHAHFRRVHHLTPLASLALARAIGSGLDPQTTRLFQDHHVILNIDELRTVICPMNKSFKNYPTLPIPNFPCNTIKQVKHLRDHLRRVHRFTNRAINVIIKAVKSNESVHTIEFPQWIDIIENVHHL